MTSKRKYVTADAYRLMVLAALAYRSGSVSKGALAWETRANHYMITRVLRELHAAGLVQIDAAPEGGFAVRLTEAGRDYYRRTGPALRQVFQDALEAQYRFGPVPRWLRND